MPQSDPISGSVVLRRVLERTQESDHGSRGLRPEILRRVDASPRCVDADGTSFSSFHLAREATAA
jgi:hypothetical protein